MPNKPGALAPLAKLDHMGVYPAEYVRNRAQRLRSERAVQGTRSMRLALLLFLSLPALLLSERAKIPPPDFPEWKDWSLVSSRPLINARLVDKHNPPSPHTLQASYPWDNFVEQVGFPDKNLAYGSVLNSHRRYGVSGVGKDTKATYAGIVSALEFGVKAIVPAVVDSAEAMRQWPNVTRDELAEGLSLGEYTLTDAFVAPLRCAGT